MGTFSVFSAGDSPAWKSYDEAMELGHPFIRLKLNTDHAIELGEFVSAFTAISSQYDRYIRITKPDADPNATLFVKDIREGCIEADLVPWLKGAAYVVGGGIGFVAAANSIADFVTTYGALLGFYKKKNAEAPDATVSVLTDVIDQVAAIAESPDSSLEIAAIEFKQGKQITKVALKFDTKDAKKIRDHAIEHRRRIESTSNATHARVLMIFAQTNVKPSKVGARRTGDRVIINAIAPGKDLPLVYATTMAEQAIKQEIRDAQDNVYLKGFEVDVNVEMRGDKPIAYRVTHLHDVLDIEP